MLISMVGCSFMIIQTYKKWQASPVIVSFDEKSIPIWEITFPAVTICPVIKIDRDKLNMTKLMEIARNDTSDTEKFKNEMKQFLTVFQTCENDNTDNGMNRETAKLMQEIEIISLLKKITILKSERLFDIIYGGVNQTDDFFSEILTENGICFTSNILQKSELLREEK